jgi:hypothetical protein
VRLAPGTGPSFFWVHLAECEQHHIRDETNRQGVVFCLGRNDNTANPAKTERTEWVGPYLLKDDKWVAQVKLFRQYDKQYGGSGSIYNDHDVAMTPQPDGSVQCRPPFWKPIPLARVSREVSDEMAKRIIDAYLLKCP